MFYVSADPPREAYYRLDLPFLVSCDYWPNMSRLTKADVNGTYRSFARENHPDKGGDADVFTYMSSFFKDALEAFDEVRDDIRALGEDVDSCRVIWVVSDADFALEHCETGDVRPAPSIADVVATRMKGKTQTVQCCQGS